MIIALHSFVISFFVFLAPVIQSDINLLKEVQTKYETVENFTADFRQITGTGHVSTGTFFYKTKDNFRIELDNRVLISDGETIWNFTPKSDKVIISIAEEESNSFSIDDYIYKYPQQCSINYDTYGKLNVVILKPKNGELDFKEVKLWINAESVVQKLQLIDFMDNRFIVELTNIKLNNDLSSDLFTFTPKEGTRVIDLR